MPIAFRCSQCQKMIQAPDGTEGRQVRCPACQAVMSVPFAAGALYSTVEDLYRWDQALYGEQLLPARLRDLLFKPNLDNYGYGWGILVPASVSPYAGESIPMHGGAIFGFQSVIQRIIQHRELIVLLDDNDSPKLLEIALEIRRALASNP